jgi:hypothetical protein
MMSAAQATSILSLTVLNSSVKIGTAFATVIPQISSKEPHYVHRL